MTLPDERTRAVLAVLSFLYDLIDPTETPKVPRKIREKASRLVKHYPHWHDMIDPAQAFEPVKRIK